MIMAWLSFGCSQFMITTVWVPITRGDVAIACCCCATSMKKTNAVEATNDLLCLSLCIPCATLAPPNSQMIAEKNPNQRSCGQILKLFPFSYPLEFTLNSVGHVDVDVAFGIDVFLHGMLKILPQTDYAGASL